MVLTGGVTRSGKWKSYASVAENLILQGYYNGVFEAIVDCRKAGNQTFIVVDAPSGSGKTLFGMALLLMDRDRIGLGGNLSAERNRFVSNGVDLKVVHCIWPAAIKGQTIYQDIIDEQSVIAPNKIFERAKFLDMQQVLNGKDTDSIERHVWFTVLQFVFELRIKEIAENEEKFSVSEFLEKKNLEGRHILIYADEVPTKLSELNVIYNLRESIKRIRGVSIVLSGTNSKAASMIGLSDATSTDINLKPWALFVTRLPSFQIELSDLKDTWNLAKSTLSSCQSDLVFARNAIESSLRCGNNLLYLVYSRDYIIFGEILFK